MYIAIISFLLIVCMAGYTMVLTYRYKAKLTCMAGMMIAMTSGMMSSLVLGTVIGSMAEGKMLIPTIGAVIAGMAIGYFTGIPITPMAGLDGMMAGIMGGMMGAMLGVMVTIQNPEMMILFIDAVYVIVMLVLVKVIRQEAGVIQVSTKEIQKKSSSNPSRTIYMAIFGIILLFGINKFGSMHANPAPANAVGETVSQQSIEAVQKDGYQEVNISIGPYGYTPDQVKVKAGIPVKMNFQKDYKGGCLSVFVMQDFNIKQSLSAGKTTIDLKPDKPGTYSFTCGMGMYGGTLVVES